MGVMSGVKSENCLSSKIGGTFEGWRARIKALITHLLGKALRAVPSFFSSKASASFFECQVFTDIWAGSHTEPGRLNFHPWMRLKRSSQRDSRCRNRPFRAFFSRLQQKTFRKQQAEMSPLVKDEGTTPRLRFQAAVQQKGGVMFMRNSISLSVLSASAANPLLLTTCHSAAAHGWKQQWGKPLYFLPLPN